MKNTLWESPKYKSFVTDRNKELERVNLNAQVDVSRMLYEVLDRITGFVSHMAIQDQMSLNHLKWITSQLEQYLDHQFHPLADLIHRRIYRMRKATFTITYIAELEAIARATQKTKSMNSMDFQNKLRDQLRNERFISNKRIWVALTNIKHKIIKSFQSSIVREESPKEVVDAVKKSYPPIIGFKVPPRALKRVIEADRPKRPEDEEEGQEFDFYSSLTTPEDWELAVQAYKDTELPPSRFDSTGSKYDPEDSVFKYDWELEQDMTDDFVQQVRDGQVEAAEDLGVKDFVWVAIIDKKTCDVCCLPRNGKTTSEIERMLQTGELDKDECDATTPPAHPYCRCDLAPVADVSEVPGPNWKEFGDWLNS